MAHDKEGNLLPFMLSDLIRSAKEAMDKHGDIPVGIYSCVPGNEFNEERSLPVSGPATVVTPSWMDDYWPGKFHSAFVLDGA